MRKTFIFFVLCLGIKTLTYTETFANKSGKIKNSYNNVKNDPDYSLNIICEDGKDKVHIGDFWFLKGETTFTINYDKALVAGGSGGPGGYSGSTTETELFIQENDKEISTGINENNQYTKSFTVKPGIEYKIILNEKRTTSVSSSPEITQLYYTRIVTANETVDNSGSVYVLDYNGVLASYTGQLPENKKFELTVSCEKACVTEDNYRNPVWYVKKGQRITGTYKPNQYSSISTGYDEQTQTGSGSYTSDKTELRINDKAVDNIPGSAEGDMKIQLFQIHDDSLKGHKETCLVEINIKADADLPAKPTLTNSDGAWKTGGGITAVSSDNTTGVRFLKYRINKSQNWITGNSYSPSVASGEIFTASVDFVAVDYVGNESETASAALKIDKRNPVVESDYASDVWYNHNVEVRASDAGSGVKTIYVDNVSRTNPFTITQDGSHEVYAEDNVGQSSSHRTFKVDKTSPVISAKADGVNYNSTWTNKEVTVSATDSSSGIKNFLIDGIVSRNPNILQTTGRHTVTAEDEAGNSSTAVILIDKTEPVSSWKSNTFTDFTYNNDGEARLLKSININYSVTEDDSGIKTKGNILRRDGAKIAEDSIKEMSVPDNISARNREADNTLIYTADVTDNAGNAADTIRKTLVLPKKIILQTIRTEQETETLRRSEIKDGYTTIGLLINKINFSLYKTITIKRTYLGDKSEGAGDRSIIDYERYKAFFDENVQETEIKEKWNKEQEVNITDKDVKAVTVDGINYWYFEDKIRTDSGLGHKGIRYQAEWTWNTLDITECSSYAVIEKTANNPGKLNLRLEGTDENGTESRYVVLDKNGGIVENESDSDFFVPADGVVKISFRIEDDDTDIYNVQAAELITADFIDKESGNIEEKEISFPKEGFSSDGYITKKNKNGVFVSEYRKKQKTEDGWYEPDIPELKLYYNKPLNMRITMTEGCAGSDGAYKDITESGIIMLKAVNPDLGGFCLLVGQEAVYNKDGITARPHQKISLGLEDKNSADSISTVEWNFGDGKKTKGISVEHAYEQSPDRTGNVSEYKMSIKLNQSQAEKQALINVNIVDTQSGMLLGNEVWIGRHPVLNRIQVPSGISLIIKENDKWPENITKVLGSGSPSEDRKGWLEILSGGYLEVAGGKEAIVFTEEKNGIEFTEIKTAGENGTDESFKWKGISINAGAKAELKNLEIKHAVTGLNISGTAGTDKINIETCNTGLFIDESGSLKADSAIKVNDASYGIKCEGTLSAESIELNGIKENGISAGGTVSVTKDFSIEGTGDCGVEAYDDSEITVGKNLSITGFKKGINNTASFTAGNSISVSDSKEYGIRNEGKLKCQILELNSREGRGFVAGSGSITESKSTTIKAAETGIHCIGNVKADFGKCDITGVIYGIKTDRTGNDIPDINISTGSSINGAKVLWYDWKDGVLTDMEIKEKMSEE